MALKHQKVVNAVVGTGGHIDEKQVKLKLALFDAQLNPIPLDAIDGTPQTGATVILTGYAPHAVGAVLAADSANVAIAKLEARIAALEA